jgi:hypothetical protein
MRPPPQPIDPLTQRVIADATIWPGVPVASWTAAQPGQPFTAPVGRGIRRLDGPLVGWLPVKTGLTSHGLRHSHKTWMAEDGFPEILSEQRLGHEVPGMRGLYAHVSERMRRELTEALQRRWEDSLRARAAVAPRAAVKMLNDLLKPYQETQREKLISQIPPPIERSPHPAGRVITVQ